jgi:hypothetical protein
MPNQCWSSASDGLSFAPDLIAPFEGRETRETYHTGLFESGPAEIRNLDIIQTHVLHETGDRDHRTEAGTVCRVGRVGRDEQGRAALGRMTFDEGKWRYPSA